MSLPWVDTHAVLIAGHMMVERVRVRRGRVLRGEQGYQQNCYEFA